MSGRARQVVAWLHAGLAGARLARALERHRRAAEELDEAVREVLAR